METRAYKNWWILAANGLIAVLFGLLLLGFTQEVIKTIVIWFGAIVLICGLGLVALSIRNIRQDKGSLVIILEAVITIAIGLVILVKPGDSLDLFLTLIGIWAIVIGIIQLVILINIKEAVSQRNLLLVNALVTIGLGAVLIFFKGIFASFLVTVIGILSLALGILMIYFSFLLRGVKLVPKAKEEAK